jgi:hypothetical protein
MINAIILILLCSFIAPALHAEDLVPSKVASIYISESFINEQLASHLAKSSLIKSLKMKLDTKTNKMFMYGDFRLPLDDFRAIGVERDLADFKFQLSILPQISPQGHLVLEFPISETYFYQANSKNPKRDRVVIPVQLLSLGLAATRGYLAALSGDFSTFDRKDAKLKALLRGVKLTLATEKNLDAVDVLKSEKKSLELQIASIELDRVNFARTAKTLNSIFAFTGEKEFNLNNEIQASKNSIMLKLRLTKLVPYLKDIELGGIRMANSKPTNDGENYLIFDINTPLTKVPPQEPKPAYSGNTAKVPPSLMIRLNQSLFTSKLIAEKEKAISEDIKDFKIDFRNNGIRISGTVKKFFMDVPFKGTVDFISTGPDVFEVRLRELKILNIDVKFLTPLALKAVERRLKKALKGMCTYEYMGNKEHSRVLQVKIEPKKLIPALPDFHLIDVDIRTRNFMLKIGRIN